MDKTYRWTVTKEITIDIDSVVNYVILNETYFDVTNASEVKNQIDMAIRLAIPNAFYYNLPNTVIQDIYKECKKHHPTWNYDACEIKED